MLSTSTIGALLSLHTLASALPNPNLLFSRGFNPLPDDPSNSPVSVMDLEQEVSSTCGSNTYTYDQIYDAISWAIKLGEKGIARGKKSKQYPNGRFPHFITSPELSWGDNCPNDENRMEYPIVFDGPYNGGLRNGQWGEDRVVYYHEPGEVGSNGDPIGYYCGLITHTGADPKSSFLQCT